MASCELSDDCAFFNDLMQRMPARANMLRNDCCNSNKHDCARYMVHQRLRKGRPTKSKCQLIDRVMNNLSPDDKVKAREVIRWIEKA